MSDCRNSSSRINSLTWLPNRCRCRAAALFHPDNAAKAEMACGGIDRLRHARGGARALAGMGRAKVRSAFHHFARNLNFWRMGIITFLPLPASGIETRAAGMRNFTVFLIPILRPFPDVARHVVKTIGIRGTS